MNAKEVLVKQHARTHSSGMTTCDLSLEDMLVDGLTEAQLRQCPSGMNSVAWFLWHMARAEDVAANLLVSPAEQVFDSDGWATKLRLPRRDIGTGMTAEEVRDLSGAIDVDALFQYRRAVGNRTQEIIQALSVDTLYESPPSEAFDELRTQGAIAAPADWMITFWQGRTREFFVSFTIIGHNYSQIGEAFVNRGLVA